MCPAVGSISLAHTAHHLWGHIIKSSFNDPFAGLSFHNETAQLTKLFNKLTALTFTFHLIFFPPADRVNLNKLHNYLLSSYLNMHSGIGTLSVKYRNLHIHIGKFWQNSLSSLTCDFMEVFAHLNMWWRLIKSGIKLNYRLIGNSVNQSSNQSISHAREAHTN